MPFGNAEDWFVNFRTAYESNKGLSKFYSSKKYGTIPLKEWTAAMLDMIGAMGKEDGYDIERENLRYDMLWKKTGNSMVVIEHENNAREIDNLEPEINKLFMVDCPLRVLITYFKQQRFRAQSTALNEKLLGKLRDFDRHNFELLAIIGRADKIAVNVEDEFWIAYRYHPSYRSTMLAFP